MIRMKEKNETKDKNNQWMLVEKDRNVIRDTKELWWEEENETITIINKNYNDIL